MRGFCWPCCGCCTGCRCGCRPRSAAALGRAAVPAVAGARRRIALRNLELCFPELDAAERARAGARALPLARPQPARARPALVRVAGAAAPADPRRGRRRRSPSAASGPVMWLVPHFMALDVAGVAVQLFQKRKGGSIYQAQSNAGDRRGAAPRPRCASATREIFSRDDGAKPLMRAIRRGVGLLQPARHGLRPARRRLRAVLRRAGRDAAGAVAHGARARHGRAAGGRRDAAGRRAATGCASASRGPTSRPTTPWPTRARMNRWIEARDPRATRRSTCGCTSASRRGRPASPALLTADAHRAPIIARMRLRFTKMHGAGNDFVVLDATRAPLALTPRAAAAPRRPPLRRRRRPDPGRRAQPRRRASTSATASSTASGDEVEHCGNGARCFVRYVRDKGLTDKTHDPRRDR